MNNEKAKEKESLEKLQAVIKELDTEEKEKALAYIFGMLSAKQLINAKNEDEKKGA